jgi:hypothetical protein
MLSGCFRITAGARHKIMNRYDDAYAAADTHNDAVEAASEAADETALAVEFVLLR